MLPAGTSWDSELGGCIPIESLALMTSTATVSWRQRLDGIAFSIWHDCPEPEEPETSEFTCGDPVNYHGYDYATVQIGEQCWFAENLRTEHYANGDAIPGELSNSEWSRHCKGLRRLREHAPTSMLWPLYNWYAVEDARGLCPSGWHVPTDGEIYMLELIWA